MKFENTKTISQIKRDITYKELEKSVSPLAIDSFEKKGNMRYKGRLVYIYELAVAGGIIAEFYIDKSGNVVYFAINDEVQETLASGDEKIDISAKEAGREIRRMMTHIQKRIKPSQAQVNQLMKSLKNEDIEEVERLEKLKDELQEGSGFYIVVKDGKYLSDNGFTEDKTKIVTFSDESQVPTEHKKQMIRR